MSGFSNYDQWKLSNAEDEQEERERRRQREEDLAERADYDRDREKDERCEREYNRRLHSPADE